MVYVYIVLALNETLETGILPGLGSGFSTLTFIFSHLALKVIFLLIVLLKLYLLYCYFYYSFYNKKGKIT